MDKAMTSEREEHSGNALSEGGLLRRVASLPTSGARACEIFRMDGRLFLAIPQLAYDVADLQAHMNSGDSNTDLLIFEWINGGFVPASSLPVPGGEDAEFFTIGDRRFLATASARTGAGPYQHNVDSVVYEYVGGEWVPFQRFAGFLAKQWKALRFDDRFFLALALGVTVEGVEATNPRQSAIFEWDGAAFVPFLTLDGPWGYNWTKIVVGDRQFLAYADHTGKSVMFEWTGETFAVFQRFEGKTGRAFHVLSAPGPVQVAFAAIADDTVVYRWDGENFAPMQVLSGPGGREFASITRGGTHYLVQVNFIEGSPKAPKTDLLSVIYVWSGETWERVDQFETFGGTDAAFFEADGKQHLVVTNSLTPDVRFSENTAIYEFLG
ncbi:hypothetical protein [Shinella sp.]|uniref:hypothetical protein n=1 Tax=Shinella sp. TaxID=1870904 RepID=UPI003F6F4D62